MVAAGTPAEVMPRSEASLTGRYLSGARTHPGAGRAPRRATARRLEVRGARASTTCKSVDVAFPLGTFVCVTGVSGSGKSTLVNDILLRGAARRLLRAAGRSPGAHRALRGLEHVDKVIDIDQSPDRPHAALQPGHLHRRLHAIRDLFAELPEAKRARLRARALLVQREGRALRGVRRATGCVKIEMHFLPDVYVRCEVCDGRRYNRETLEVAVQGEDRSPTCWR